jgi:hypothetical protein
LPVLYSFIFYDRDCGPRSQVVNHRLAASMTPTSGIEFLVWLLIAAAIIAMLAKRLRIPYTVAAQEKPAR